ncbi:hypothetical protein NL514_31185, partial [Klebsiella pneumoniae]|nr:hypothetical protein [Klebsiella pneumoniae]
INSKKNINYKELIFSCLTTSFRAQGVTKDSAARGLQDEEEITPGDSVCRRLATFNQRLFS